MSCFLGVVAVLLILTALVMWALAIWTYDGRWGRMGLLFLFPGLFLGTSVGVHRALDA